MIGVARELWITLMNMFRVSFSKKDECSSRRLDSAVTGWRCWEDCPLDIFQGAVITVIANKSP